MAVGATWGSSERGSLNITERLPFGCAQGGEHVEPQPRNKFPVEVALQGYVWCAERVTSDVRPVPSGKKRANAPEGHCGVGVQAPTQGLQG